MLVEEESIFYIDAKEGGLSAMKRAEMEAQAIGELGRRIKLNTDSVY